MRVEAVIYVERGDDELEVTVSGVWTAAEPDVGLHAGFEDFEASTELSPDEQDQAVDALEREMGASLWARD